MLNNNDPSQREQAREAWIEALLASAARPQDHSERIVRAMDEIRSLEANSPPDRSRTRWIPWVALALAASLFVGAFTWFSQMTTPTALAAVRRSIQVAARPETRKYTLTLTVRSATGPPEQIENELYVRGADRFALRRPGLLLGKSLWLGQDGEEAWVVPPVGPVRKGDALVLSRWLRSHRDLETPYLHVATLLKRMSDGYRLEELPDESIETPSGSVESCLHIRGTRKAVSDANRPSLIELWTNRDTGVAMRLIAHWDEFGTEPRVASIEIVFRGDEPELQDNWFTAESHYRGRRVIVRVDEPGRP